MKLALGTVQFGLDYGISNAAGRVPPAEVAAILAAAAPLGVDVLDTAPAYGESEAVLGRALPATAGFKLVTKTPPLRRPALSAQDVSGVREAFLASLGRLGLDRAHGLLVHHASDLLVPGGERLHAALEALRAEGKVEKIGVSVYSGAELDAVLARGAIDLVQLPLNVLDQRLARSGHLAELRARGIEIHVRSAFLQGLLLMPPEALGPSFEGVREHLRGYHGWLAAQGVDPLRGALGFLRGVSEIDHVVVGVTSRRQLEEVAAAWASAPIAGYERFEWGDEGVLNPALWRAA